MLTFASAISRHLSEDDGLVFVMAPNKVPMWLVLLGRCRYSSASPSTYDS
jgi:hypothetical protein